ncbi:hypothetical protein G6F57_023206 [Rhizopus arrhizus]|nr:hypothetical protein G6F57_023206 [Rhizopus arrhizus]
MHAAASAVTSFWVEAGTDDEGDAKRALREREAIPSKNMERHLGVWTHGCPAPASIPGLADWAAARGITTWKKQLPTSQASQGKLRRSQKSTSGEPRPRLTPSIVVSLLHG